MAKRKKKQVAAGASDRAELWGQPHDNAAPDAGFDAGSEPSNVSDGVEPRYEFLEAFARSCDGEEFLFFG